MNSMTGFGLVRFETLHSEYEISIRTVNGRFLETRFHLPRELLALESECKKIISSVFRRGTMDIFISRRLKTSELKVTVNKDLAKIYKKEMMALAKSLSITSTKSISLETLIRMPEVLKTESPDNFDKKESQTVLKKFKEACDACNSERAREGDGLKNELLRLLSDLDARIQVMSEMRDDANAQLQERLKSKIQQKLETPVDPQRLAQEVAYMLDRADINEELVRLKEHFSAYRTLLNSKEVEGKKLDFYTQELLREVNTIGSKTQIAKLTQSVVEAKTIIERIREQVQNVE